MEIRIGVQAQMIRMIQLNTIENQYTKHLIHVGSYKFIIGLHQIFFQSLGDKLRGSPKTFDATQPVMKTTFINMTH
jgi:hypothetical protein